ncbi:unnamed protein product, partial [Larinioides sclopetarius]
MTRFYFFNFNVETGSSMDNRLKRFTRDLHFGTEELKSFLPDSITTDAFATANTNSPVLQMYRTLSQGLFGCPTRKAGRWSILLDRIRKHRHVSWVEGRFLKIQGSNCVQTVTKDLEPNASAELLLCLNLGMVF